MSNYLFRMIVAICTRCNHRFSAADDESPSRIIDRLDEHITKCPQAAFTFDVDRRVGEQKISGSHEAIEDAHKKQ